MESTKKICRVNSGALLMLKRAQEEIHGSGEWDEDWWNDLELHNASSAPTCETEIKIVNPYLLSINLYEYQGKGECESLSDLRIVVEDGFIPVHRVVFMGKSEFLDELLQVGYQVTLPGDTSVSTITLAGVKLCHMQPIVSLMYTGKATVSLVDEEQIREVIKMLGLTESIITAGNRINPITNIFERKPVRVVLWNGECSHEIGNTREAEAALIIPVPQQTPSVVAEDENGSENESRSTPDENASENESRPTPDENVNPSLANKSSITATAMKTKEHIFKFPKSRQVKLISMKKSRSVYRRIGKRPAKATRIRKRAIVHSQTSEVPGPSTLLTAKNVQIGLRSVSPVSTLTSETTTTQPTSPMSSQSSSLTGIDSISQINTSPVKKNIRRKRPYRITGPSASQIKLNKLISKNRKRHLKRYRKRFRRDVQHLNNSRRRIRSRPFMRQRSYPMSISRYEQDDDFTLPEELLPSSVIRGSPYPRRTRPPPGFFMEPASSLCSEVGSSIQDQSDISTTSYMQCPFCKKYFCSLALLNSHLEMDRYCGKHIRGFYNLPEKHCMSCSVEYEYLDFQKFLDHVSRCVLDKVGNRWNIINNRILPPSSDDETVLD